ncbi:SGNH/GDSL hydrolase family protein [uncultured Shewanella sp.]|uniref:SGNH/GDSL hydrolase family protein n=1 Tax=uncultured Shewanella sp. TaxID=173975 RepID=UPI0026131AA5|nr:SGNH/GDSL hydrolase family protein [uncultured Shewanella sp.]
MHYLSLLLLWPVYLLQAIWVKKTTLKLPEPNGLREGVVKLNDTENSSFNSEANDGSGANSTTLSLLIVGDSAAAGVGVETQQQALSGQLVTSLSSMMCQTTQSSALGDYKLKWQLIAKSGYSTQNCLNKFNYILSQPHQISADVVVISLGVNDVLSPISAKTWINQQQQLCELLFTSLACQQIIITSVPPMSAFPALPQPFRWFLGARSNEFNHALTQWIKSCALPCEQLDMRQSLASATMAKDGFHPSESIYQHWGKQAAILISNKINAENVKHQHLA